MINFNTTWINFECPRCRYSDEVQLIDVKTEKSIYCHNCKAIIKLFDNNASVHTGIDNMNHALKELEKTLKNFGK
jgi:hypothetical protein